MADLHSISDPVAERYQAQYDASRDDLPGGTNERIAALRAEAAGLIGSTLPLRRQESWKYTDLRRVFRDMAKPGAEADTVLGQEDIAPFALDGCEQIVFVDGALSHELSTIVGQDGVKLTPLAGALTDDLPVGSIADLNRPGLTALNSTLMSTGVAITVEKSAVAEKPIQILFVSTAEFGAETHARLFVSLGANASATLLETHVALGQGGGLTNLVMESDIGDGARLNHVKLQQQSDAATHIAQHTAKLARDSQLRGFTLATGGNLSRLETQIKLEKPGAECRLGGIALMRGRQHCDITTDISHNADHCESHQTFKNVVDGRGRAVFQGRVYVAPDAQKTSAHQLNRNLLLSRDAQADAKPELVIHADDVKCSHGATVGDLDADALFYLQSRGIPENDARNLLIEGFAAELIDDIEQDEIASVLMKALSDWLAGNAEARQAA